MIKNNIRFILLLFLFGSMSTIAQNSDDAQKQREEFEQQALEKLNERIQMFLATLEIDDFQKEIIKQKLDSYYNKKKVIFMDRSLKYYERDERLMALDNNHFLDIKNMISEDTMNQIQLFIKDAGTTLEKEKKKNEKRKRKTKKEK